MPRLDRAVADVAVAPDVVYAAFVDADALGTWLPPDGMTGELTSFDAREGGGFTMALTYTEGSGGRGKTTADTDVTRVAIDELVPDERVVWGVEFESEDAARTAAERIGTNVPDGVTFEGAEVREVVASA